MIHLRAKLCFTVSPNFPDTVLLSAVPLPPTLLLAMLLQVSIYSRNPEPKQPQARHFIRTNEGS